MRTNIFGSAVLVSHWNIGHNSVKMKLWVTIVLMNLLSVRSNCQLALLQGQVRIDSINAKKSISMEGPLALIITNLIFIPTIGQLSVDDFGSYCRIFFDSPESELRLDDGKKVGQIILIEGSLDGQPWLLADNPSPGGNVDLSMNHVLSKGDLIQLIWNGSNWIEIDFRDN